MNKNQTPAASASRHTDEPWMYSGLKESFPIRTKSSTAINLAHPANAARIVACVNALAGMEPGAVAGLVAAVEKYLQVNSVGNRAVLRSALAALKGGAK